ncbi:MAG: TetR/AcrR family transcriptional regulator, partial [Luminiphilus sp.]|nr:TetR/AcrR family transcriptional regulator [Luminiphilus sp.]
SVSMSRIAELSDVSTKTLYNLFGSRSGLLLAAAAQTRTNILESEPLANAPEGLSRIIELTKRTMANFRASPDFMASAMSVVVAITPDEEAQHHRIGITQQLFQESLVIAKSEGELKPGTDCLQLSQLMAASQWGVTLLWQKQLISLEALEKHAIMKHCLDLMPFAQPETGAWLQKLLYETGPPQLCAGAHSWTEASRMAS